MHIVYINPVGLSSISKLFSFTFGFVKSELSFLEHMETKYREIIRNSRNINFLYAFNSANTQIFSITLTFTSILQHFNRFSSVGCCYFYNCQLRCTSVVTHFFLLVLLFANYFVYLFNSCNL